MARRVPMVVTWSTVQIPKSTTEIVFFSSGPSRVKPARAHFRLRSVPWSPSRIVRMQPARRLMCLCSALVRLRTTRCAKTQDCQAARNAYVRVWAYNGIDFPVMRGTGPHATHRLDRCQASFPDNTCTMITSRASHGLLQEQRGWHCPECVSTCYLCPCCLLSL